MEVRAGVRKADRRAVVLHVGQDQDVGVLGMMELVDHVRLGPAELARELEELHRLQPQVSEHQDLPGKERIPDFPEIGADRVSLQPETAEFPQPHTFSLGTSSHFYLCQLFQPSSASCTPLAPSSRFQRKPPSPATCLRKSSHCTLKASS